MAKKDYSNWTKEELIKELEKLKKQKKYGLVWEDKPEQVALMCKEKLPILTEDKSKEIITDKNKPTNILIEGDNYHALSVLNYTHKGKIDVIYIDPPYNTGARDWKYNNDYVDINDQWRHSKWLSMMEKRLRLAKNLLKHDGVLICAIDENEFHHLGCLLEEIFNGWEMHCITIVHNPRGIQGNNFSYCHEYAYFVFRKGLKVINPRKIKEEEIDWRGLRDSGKESLRTDARNCFYPILVKDEKIIGFGGIPDNNYHPKSKNIIRKDGIIEVWPIDTKGIERKWRYARQSVESIKHLLRVKKIREEYDIEIGKDFGIVRTVWQDSRYDAAEYGTKLVQKLVPSVSFDFPKSVFNTYDCLSIVVEKRKDAIVFDFFAGSGTTGHAVMLLNNEDNGKRKFILCTNNEVGEKSEKEFKEKYKIDDKTLKEWKEKNKKEWLEWAEKYGICSSVCYPRIKAVMKKHPDYPEITGIKTNLKYFKTDFVDAKPTDKNKKKLVDESTEMLCLKEDCFDFVSKGHNFKIFKNNEDKYLGIIYDDDGIEPFKEEAKKLKKKFVVYVFSLDDSAREEEFEDLENVELKPIPAVILNVYKRIFKNI
ncbi:MAG: site-specific DNA-methyltransferase [Candidatus Aenigmatarchaeota archaeon]